MESTLVPDSRWQLYKVLSEPQRLRLLFAASVESLSVGELAELLGESQPNVSRQLSPLRRMGVLTERKQGTRVFVQLDVEAQQDPVVRDALVAGQMLCESEGVLARIPLLVRKRDAAAREFFARTEAGLASLEVESFPAELPAYLRALSCLLPRRALAIDAGAGDGRLLEVLAPVFERVIAVDRERVQLDRAAERLAHRGHSNVRLVTADLLDNEACAQALPQGEADVVFASRVLHHAPQPGQFLRTLADLLLPGGALVIVDYAPHEDETLREEQADLWLGFSHDEMLKLLGLAGLVDFELTPVPSALCGGGPDKHLQWQTMVARRPN